MRQDDSEITLLLRAINLGDPSALNEFWELIYDELKRLASGYLKEQSPACLLSTTDLVHEVFLKFNLNAAPNL